MTHGRHMLSILLIARSGRPAVGSADPVRPVMQQADAEPAATAAPPRSALPQPAYNRTAKPSAEARSATLARVVKRIAALAEMRRAQVNRCIQQTSL